MEDKIEKILEVQFKMSFKEQKASQIIYKMSEDYCMYYIDGCQVYKQLFFEVYKNLKNKQIINILQNKGIII